MILKKMKADATQKLGYEVTDCVITCPAYFNDAQRNSTRDAGIIAGFNVRTILNEPTAAALGFCVGKENLANHNFIVVDLGGGTFDVTVLTIDHGIADVLATQGDTHLGGQDFDNRVVDFLKQKFLETDGVDITDDKRAMLRLKIEVEKMKRVLSNAMEIDIVLDTLTRDEDFSYRLSRPEFERICDAEFKKIIPVIERALKEAELTKDQMNSIVLAGGSIRIPKVK